MAPLPWHDARHALKPLVWIGAAGTVTPLHYDVCHNLYLQIVGEKRVLLVSPRFSRELRHPSLLSACYWASPVDPTSAAAAHLPRWQATLRPGDALFVPSRWRHWLRSETTTVSLGQFSEPDLDQRLLRRALALVGRPTL